MEDDFAGIKEAVQAALFRSPQPTDKIVVADLFCGAGTFTLAAESLGLAVGYAYEPDEPGSAAYASNFGVSPVNAIGDGFTDASRPPKEIDLVVCRFPKDTAEFDQVALRFLRYCKPKGILFMSPHRNTINVGIGSADVYEHEGRDAEVIRHAARRMSHLTYGTEGHLLAVREEGRDTEKRRVLAGFQQRTGGGSFDFPWNEAAERVRHDALPLPPGWTECGTGQPTPTAAKALLGTLARFVLGVGVEK